MWGWDGWWGGPLGNLWHLIVSIFWGAAHLLALLVFVGVLILLVRFLLVGTRAAQLYISRHSPTDGTPASTPTPAAPSPDSGAATTRSAATTRTAPTTRSASTARTTPTTTARTTKRLPKPPTGPTTPIDPSA